ncbi:hypothetical protein KKC52_02130, partial [bacterium]|nr:hypothetical protein [bacterium]
WWMEWHSATLHATPSTTSTYHRHVLLCLLSYGIFSGLYYGIYYTIEEDSRHICLTLPQEKA